MFRDRTDAGEKLARLLRDRGVRADLVLAIPRGGLPIGRPVADALDAPLDVAVAKKLGAPGNPELAIGAAASDGSLWLNEDAIDQLGVPDGYVERERRRAAETAREKEDAYREGDPPDVAGRSVVLVDDGVATGATVNACLRMLAERGAEHIVLAVPVGPPNARERLVGDADEVVVLESPPRFRAVGQFYERFDQVSDEEAMSYLDR
ncbi:phosphoribosyltransferase (plasmid) [Halorarum halophilum]|uniref:Phosphoribosyltransferase n=1 Tax=Halorarum halophilum TaxID=2743090 RepID=A0A7D5KI60_9EURY|nr:phosphoribosyltransferase family protein [Halobaculum halophilum]QLG29776.1 phosphoribosyltransferase [Halobaculum halophilum]